MCMRYMLWKVRLILKAVTIVFSRNILIQIKLMSLY